MNVNTYNTGSVVVFKFIPYSDVKLHYTLGYDIIHHTWGFEGHAYYPHTPSYLSITYPRVLLSVSKIVSKMELILLTVS